MCKVFLSELKKEISSISMKHGIIPLLTELLVIVSVNVVIRGTDDDFHFYTGIDFSDQVFLDSDFIGDTYNLVDDSGNFMVFSHGSSKVFKGIVFNSPVKHNYLVFVFN